MQDVRLVAGEGKLAAHHVLDAVNVILQQRALRSTPAQQPAPASPENVAWWEEQYRLQTSRVEELEAALRRHAQCALEPRAWAVLYKMSTGIWKILEDKRSADFWAKEGFPVQPLYALTSTDGGVKYWPSETIEEGSRDNTAFSSKDGCEK